MVLTLDHTQRLNIIAMLDRLECQGRRETWAVCALQAKLDLNDEERERIGYRKMKAPDGREFVLWANDNGIAVKNYDLEDAEVKRISQAMDKYPVILARDRMWWEPLNAQLPEPVESNGNAAVTRNGDKLP